MSSDQNKKHNEAIADLLRFAGRDFNSDKRKAELTRNRPDDFELPPHVLPPQRKRSYATPLFEQICETAEAHPDWLPVDIARCLGTDGNYVQKVLLRRAGATAIVGAAIAPTKCAARTELPTTKITENGISDTASELVAGTGDDTARATRTF